MATITQSQGLIKPFQTGAILLLCGLVAIFTAASRERSLESGVPWRDLAIAVEAAYVPEGALPLRTRLIPESNLPEATQELLERMRAKSGSEEALQLLGLSPTERLLMVDAPPDFFAPALLSGRLPQAGRPEVLAGALVRFDSFEMDGTTFQVVGRLSPQTPGTLEACFLPADPAFDALFSDPELSTRGWLDPDALARLDALKEAVTSGEDAPRFMMPAGRLPASITALTLSGLVLVAAGGALLQMRLLQSLAPHGGTLLGPCLTELNNRRMLLAAVHVLLYATLFGAMAGGILLPRASWNALDFTRSVFSEGVLGHIGRAYASGNILWATLATLHQNYLVGTCLYSVLPSLVFPFAGLLKNLLSFGFVGFVMAPMWTGSAVQNTYHSITLTLELEAYVVVSFAVCVLPLRVLRGIQTGDWPAEYVAGLRALVGATALAGIMLTIAAFYEAATLILLH
ncbi:MAG TPA: hypothetical protein PLD73_17925 [Candidatus Hydrogenedentes bacterium]|jgi:hypothetical protein|nr:hypothetical protein [Candidatus Hydrogenedentota bacterium]HPK00048.1 hypothetical protein [Candidatus Hydrogenedentota bacterium]